ncbi:MAG TPA: hypothetical protein VIL71_00260 [Spirillospora sp.]
MSVRRRIASILAVACALVPLTGCVIQTGGDSGDGSDGSGGEGTNQSAGDGGAGSGDTRTLQAGPVTMRIPSSWKVQPEGGGRIHVITEGTCTKQGYLTADDCTGFWILSSSALATGHEGGPFEIDSPYYPASDAQPCPGNPSYLQSLPSAPSKKSIVPVGNRYARYREWVFDCTDSTGNSKGGFTQRVVYLPVSRWLLVDNHQTPGLLGRLQDATVS